MCIKRLLSIFSLCVLMGLLVGCHEAPSSGSNPPIGESESSIELAPSSSNTLTLTNNLNVLTDFTITTSGSLSGVTITPTTCTNVQPGGSCSVTITTNSNPSGTGNVVVTNGVGDTLNIPTTLGSPSVSYSDTTISTVGSNTVTITNDSSVTDTFTSLSLALSSPSSPNAATGLVLLGTTCDESLASGASCTATIGAAAASSGTASLSFTGGNLDGESTTLTVAQPTVEFQNATGTALANAHVDSNGTSDITLKNLGAFTVQNPLIALSGTTGITKSSDTCSGTSLEGGTTCSFKLEGDDNPSATLAAYIRASGANIGDTDLSVTAGDNVSVTTVDSAAQTAAERGLSVLELQVQNNSAVGITNVSISDDSDNITILDDATHPDNCGTTLGAGTDCTFWLQASSEDTIGNNTTPVLTLSYTTGATPITENIPLTLTTSLYVAGNFQLDTGVPCLNAEGETLDDNQDCDNLARFDGTNWYQVADSKLSGSDSIILRDMIIANDRLYVTGNFSNLDVSPNSTPDNANYLANWDGFVATSVGTSSGPFIAPTANVFSKNMIGRPYSIINMLAYDGNNNTLFFNRAIATTGSPLIYRSSTLDGSSPTWTLTGSAGGATSTSPSMAFNDSSNTLYVTGPQSIIAPQDTENLISSWAATSETWSFFNNTGVSISTSALFTDGSTLYDYYFRTDDPTDRLCIATDLNTLACNTDQAMVTQRDGFPGIAGIDPNAPFGDNLMVVGSRATGLPVPLTINIPVDDLNNESALAGLNNNQIVFTAVNLGTIHYIGGTFTQFNGSTEPLACIAQVVTGSGVTTPVTGLTSDDCLSTLDANDNVIFKLLVVPSVQLGS